MELPANVRVMIDQLLASGTSYAVELGKRMLAGIVSFASQVVELVVVPVLTYYFLKDWQILKDSLIECFLLRTKQGGRCHPGYGSGDERLFTWTSPH